jgi:hypothetical protein
MNPNNETISNEDTLVDWTPSSMLEITLNTPDDFLKVKETLTRIGVASKRETNTLFQSCHILHKQGRYFIVHFKELFILDGKVSNFTVDDLSRRNTIAILLSDWGLLSIADKTKATPTASLRQIKIIPFKEKKEWSLKSKYSIGLVKK